MRKRFYSAVQIVLVCTVILLLFIIKIVNFSLNKPENKIIVYRTSYGSVYTELWSLEKQNRQNTCGYACLAFIVRRAGFNVTEYDLSSADKSTNLYELSEKAIEFGLKTQLLNVDKEEFWNNPTLCIIHFSDNHFVVFIDKQNNEAVIFDPSYGQVFVEKKVFYEMFDGKMLYIYK